MCKIELERFGTITGRARELREVDSPCDFASTAELSEAERSCNDGLAETAAEEVGRRARARSCVAQHEAAEWSGDGVTEKSCSVVGEEVA